MLSLSFSGKINQQGQGLFYMRYQEQGSGAKKIALGTQLEPTDARRLFPCWDEPSFRALYAQRLPSYQQADHRVESSGEPGHVVAEILRLGIISTGSNDAHLVVEKPHP